MRIGYACFFFTTVISSRGGRCGSVVCLVYVGEVDMYAYRPSTLLPVQSSFYCCCCCCCSSLRPSAN